MKEESNQHEQHFTPAYKPETKATKKTNSTPEKIQKKSYLDEVANEFRPLDTPEDEKKIIKVRSNEQRKRPTIDTHLNKPTITPTPQPEKMLNAPIKKESQTAKQLPETQTTVEPILVQREQKLTQILHSMEKYIQNDKGERQDLFTVDWIPTENAPTLEQQGASNLVYSRLIDTLTGIADGATQQALNPERNEWKRQNYEKIAEAIGPLVHTWSAFAKEQLPLTIDENAERNRRLKNDEVYVYKTPAVNLDDTPYDKISVFIRPEEYKNGVESRQARMTMTAIPRDKNASEISMRLDYDNNAHANELVFDLEVISKGENLLDSTTLPTSEAIKDQLGHHFKSGITEEKLGIPYGQVLRSMVEKAEANRLPPQ